MQQFYQLIFGKQQEKEEESRKQELKCYKLQQPQLHSAVVMQVQL